MKIYVLISLSYLRAYADYMETEKFRRAILQLEHLLGLSPVASIAKATDLKTCQRSLMADYLLLCGTEVMHILADGGVQAHQLNPLARSLSENRNRSEGKLF